MKKKELNPWIARWAIFFQSYQFGIGHGSGNKMKHVNALSRNNNILVLTENTFEQTLSIKLTEYKEINT